MGRRDISASPRSKLTTYLARSHSIHHARRCVARPASRHAASSRASRSAEHSGCFSCRPQDGVASSTTALRRLDHAGATVPSQLRPVSAMRHRCGAAGAVCGIVGRPLSGRPAAAPLLRPLCWALVRTQLTGCANTNPSDGSPRCLKMWVRVSSPTGIERFHIAATTAGTWEERFSFGVLSSGLPPRAVCAKTTDSQPMGSYMEGAKLTLHPQALPDKRSDGAGEMANFCIWVR